ncbi:MAG: hypothetical protein M3Y91_07305 [Actinomycetota bacterium]|nr:hypothetical protein [Actinomycetota bacterium]
MFKRFRWISMGAAVGFGGSVWAQRRVKRTMERYLPERMSADVIQRARYLADDVRGALDEGREAMRAREDELRRQLNVAGPDRPGGQVARRALPPAEPGRRRSRRRAGWRARPAPGPVSVIDVAEGHLDDPVEAPPRRQRPGE